MDFWWEFRHRYWLCHCWRRCSGTFDLFSNTCGFFFAHVHTSRICSYNCQQWIYISILADIATLISYFCIMKRFITDGIDFDWYPSFYCTRSRSVRSLAAGLLWLRAIRALGPWEVAWELFFPSGSKSVSHRQTRSLEPHFHMFRY